MHFYDFPDVFKLNITSYGWPYTYSEFASAYELPPQLPPGLTLEEIEDPFPSSQFARYNIMLNVFVCGFSSLTVLLLSRAICRVLAKT